MNNTIKKQFTNKNINLKNLVTLSLFKKLDVINNDIIAKYLASEIINNEMTSLIIFNHIGKEFGLKQKYLYCNTYLENIDDNNYKIHIKKLFNKPNIKGLEEIADFAATIDINIETIHILNCVYSYSIKLGGKRKLLLLNDIVCNLFNKFFLNLKQYLENLK